MSTESNQQDCSICLEPILEDTTVTKCGHKFHKSCLQKIYKPQCPNCRAPLKCDDLTDQEMNRIRGNVARPYYENEVGEEEMNINQNTTQRIYNLAGQLENLFVEFYRMSNVNLWQNEIAVNYMACKLEDALGLEIGYVNPSDVQRAKGVQFRFLNMLGTDIERVRSEIASLQMMT